MSKRKLLSHVGPQMLRKLRRTMALAKAEPAQTTPGITGASVNVEGATVVIHKDSNYDSYPYLYIRILYPENVAIATVEKTTLTLTLESESVDFNSEKLAFEGSGATRTATDVDLLNEAYLVTAAGQRYVIAAGIGGNLTETTYTLLENGAITDTNVIKDVSVEGIALTVQRRITQEACPGNVEWYGAPGSAASATYGWTYVVYRVVGDCTSEERLDPLEVEVAYTRDGAPGDTGQTMDLSVSYPRMEAGGITYVMVVKLAATTEVPYQVNFEELDGIKDKIPSDLWTKAETYKKEIIQAFHGYAESRGAKDVVAPGQSGGGTITVNIGTTVMEVMQGIIAYGEANGFTGVTKVVGLDTYMESLDGLDTEILEAYNGEGWEYIIVPYKPICDVITVSAADYAMGLGAEITWFFLTQEDDHKWVTP